LRAYKGSGLWIPLRAVSSPALGKEENMKAFEAAARFAAYTWYTGSRQNPSPTMAAEARRFTSKNWQAFLPLAEEGWGELLLCVAKARPMPHHRAKPNRRGHNRLQLEERNA
jgi:hypothetical protein